MMPSHEPKKIIIVGAGMAGLAAGCKLKSLGFDITILEARNRLGGRIWTDHSWGLPLSLGATWIHGLEHNPLAELAHQFNAPLKLTDFNHALCYLHNRELLTSDKIEVYSQQFQQALAQIEQKNKMAQQDQPLSTTISQMLQQSPALKTQPQLLLLQLEKICLYMGATPNQLSSHYLHEEKILSGGNYYLLDSYEPIINGLAKNLSIKLNTLVKKIIYHHDNVEIVTPQDTYYANAAVITSSLGALKKELIHFEPALTLEKQSAIKSLGMGTYDKVILQFSQPFWPLDYQVLYCSRYREQLVSTFFNEFNFLNQPILTGLISNAKLAAIQNLSDEEIIEDTLQTLKYYFGNNIPSLKNYRITHWWKDPLTQGSYSFIPVGATGHDYDVLAEPTANRLFFAGEATCKKYLGTVHGAYVSGIRAAQEIAALISS
jgi:polyamine oxidase